MLEHFSNERNFAEGPEIPMGLGLALAQNVDAMNRFAALPDSQKREVIEHTHVIHSKKEMQAYVASLFGEL